MRLNDEQIGIELRALRPTPSQEFAAELDHRAGAGFPWVEETPAEGAVPPASPGIFGSLRSRYEQLQRRPIRAALVGGAVLVFAATVGVAGYSVLQDNGGSETLSKRGEPASGNEAFDSAQGQRGAAPAGESIEPAPTTAVPVPPAPPPGQDRARLGREHVQEHSASLTLSTEPDQLQAVADGVVDVTDRYRGFVQSSNVSTGDAFPGTDIRPEDAGRGRSSFTLRIPTANLQAALADLSDLGHVVSRNEGTLDITAPFVSAGERYNDARAEVASLLDQLQEASSASEIASIREQLRTARSEMAAARTELRAVKQRASLTTVTVSLVADGDGDGWSIGDAASDAVNVLEAIGGAALITLAVLVPLGALSYIGWLGAGELGRRRRERALDRD